MPISDGAAAYVAEAAIAWDQARREAARLRAERSSFTCEHESNAEFDELGKCVEEAVPTCWRNTWMDRQGVDRTLPLDEWCEPCRKSHAVHEAYTKAVHHRQALMRGLQRRALTAFESLAESLCRCGHHRESHAYTLIGGEPKIYRSDCNHCACEHFDAK